MYYIVLVRHVQKINFVYLFIGLDEKYTVSTAEAILEKGYSQLPIEEVSKSTESSKKQIHRQRQIISICKISL